MKNEAEFKTMFKRSVSYERGMSISLAAPMLVGTPDLYVAMPGFLPILIEAKWLGTITKDTFKRKVQYTPMQRMYLTQIHNIVPYGAVGLVGFKFQGQTWAVMLPCDNSHFDSITHSFVTETANCLLLKATPLMPRRFSVSMLFDQVPIPRLARGHNELSGRIRSDIPNTLASPSVADIRTFGKVFTEG